jgi:hypothetical protein
VYLKSSGSEDVSLQQLQHATLIACLWLLLTRLLQADMREMIEAEKSATALVKALKADLASEKQQHEERVRVAAAPNAAPMKSIIKAAASWLLHPACNAFRTLS